MNSCLLNNENRIPRADYPRPQWMRREWLCLNGEWEFAFDFSNSGRERDMQSGGDYPLRILVPFCPESKLSGIVYRDFIPAVWYRKKLYLKRRPGYRMIINFGAVDYLSELFVNGQSVGTHRGGYSSFSFDITDFVGDGENTLVVYAQDNTRSASQPVGKQSTEYKSFACSYTRTTGIWQTVWIEYVPMGYLMRAKLTPNAQDGTLAMELFGDGIKAGDYVTASASYQGQDVGSTRIGFSGQTACGSIVLTEKHCWNVGKPELYDLLFQLHDAKSGAVTDTVYSYFGLRDVTLNETALTVNQQPVFMRLVLDQGFNPDGIYTFPDDHALKHDIELMQDLGFNGARLHQRVFEERTLYWADRMGYIVWSEYANGNDVGSAQCIEDFMPEWLEVMKRDYNHPSIVGWCPFNETYHAMALDTETHRILYNVTKAFDPFRPCIDASGGMHYDTDMFDVHDYEQDPEKYAAYFEPMKSDKSACHVPINRYVGNSPRRPIAYKGQPYWVSEYGGTFWKPSIANESTEGWGYGDAPHSEQEFAERYAALTRVLMQHPRICGFCYTQLTDIEQEQNGLFLYDRSPKFSLAVYDKIREVNTETAAVERQ